MRLRSDYVDAAAPRTWTILLRETSSFIRSANARAVVGAVPATKSVPHTR